MECWSYGMMEFWVSNADDGLILSSDPRQPYKVRSHSAKRGSSVFQYSSIPSFHTAHQENGRKN